MKINLKGIAIGDGWVDPLNQVNFYDGYMKSVGIVEREAASLIRFFQT